MIMCNIFLIMLFVSTMCFVYKRQLMRGGVMLTMLAILFLFRFNLQEWFASIATDIENTMQSLHWLIIIANIIAYMMLLEHHHPRIMSILLALIRIPILFMSNLGLIWVFSIMITLGCMILLHTSSHKVLSFLDEVNSSWTYAPFVAASIFDAAMLCIF